MMLHMTTTEIILVVLLLMMRAGRQTHFYILLLLVVQLLIVTIFTATGSVREALKGVENGPLCSLYELARRLHEKIVG